MIGKVIIPDGGDDIVATLEDDGTWTCPVEAIADDLNADLAVTDYSPADGQRGYRQLAEAAARWNGRVEAPEIEEGEEGLVY